MLLHEYGVIPIDVPPAPFEFSRLRAFVQAYCEQCGFTNNCIRYVAFYARKPFLNGKLALHCVHQQSPLIDEHSRFDWDPEFRVAFPEVVEWFSCLPLRRLNGVVLVTQTDDIPDHVDIYGQQSSRTYFERFKDVEPKNYRILVADHHDDAVQRGAFYVTQTYRGERQYVRLPPETNVFALSASVCYHGSTYHRGHHKTTVVIHGVVDPERHVALLNRSLHRFGDHAIRFPGAGPAMGPAAQFPYQGVEADAH